MATEENQPTKSADPAEEQKWPGSVRKGKLWCDCEVARQARCLTTKKGPNKGKKFWTCPEGRKKQCPFFIWEEDEAEAKAWLIEHGPQEAPETPPRTTLPPKSPENPWTKSKKKPVSREVSDEMENGGPSKRKVDDGDVFHGEDEGAESPSRKAAKTNSLSTPGGRKSRRVALPPTPETLDRGKRKAVEAAPVEEANTSPTTRPPKDSPTTRTGQQVSDLTTRVMNLLREENLDLKGSTELLIRHEIDEELDLNATKVKSRERTISRMAEKIDELETKISTWIGDDSSDGPI